MQKHISKIRMLFILFFISILSFGNNIAFAEVNGNVKSLPGSSCIAYRNQDSVSYSNAIGAITNKLSTRNFVICPIVRDNHKANNSHLFSVRINLNKKTTARVACYLGSHSADGGTSRYYYTSISGSGYQRITFNQNISSFRMGAFSLICGLNGSDRLINYSWEEVYIDDPDYI